MKTTILFVILILIIAQTKAQIIIVDSTFTQSLDIYGHKWDNAIIKNCTFKNTILSDGIRIADANNVLIDSCIFNNIQGNGLRLHPEGVSDGVIIQNCSFDSIYGNGVLADEHHINTQILNNKFNWIGLDTQSAAIGKPHHGIYFSGNNFLISGNRIINIYNDNGNCISVRSDGIVRNNVLSNATKNGVNYYSDHPNVGGMALIENNIIYNCQRGISISDGGEPYVDSMVIRFNTVITTNLMCVSVGSGLDMNIEIYGNILVRTDGNANFIWAESQYIGMKNLFSAIDVGFVDYLNNNYHITDQSLSYNFATGLLNFPSTDFENDIRNSDRLDAGADQSVNSTQTFNLNIINGYGSGNFNAGDTTHIWSAEYDSLHYFSHWEGNVEYLENPNEWHTKIIIPNKNITLTAIIKTMPEYEIKFEQIQGVNNLKNVYYFFPNYLKGVILMFHGTSGHASGWIDKPEGRSIVNYAIANHYGIIATEAEEITLNQDLNKDGKFRWLTFPVDTIDGIDYLNIKSIINTFISRGSFSVSTPLFSVGMSNGGSFSATISSVFNFNAGVSYCASSAQGVFESRKNPFAFRMAKYDDNEEVGEEGNLDAYNYHKLLLERGIDSDYQILDKQPIYPERFARVTGISSEISEKIFMEFKNNGLIDNFGYAVSSDSMINYISKYPAKFPIINSLKSEMRLNISAQIGVANAEHQFYSDYNYSTIAFFDKHLQVETSVEETIYDVIIFPNPAEEYIEISLERCPTLSKCRTSENVDIKIYNTFGELVLSDVQHLGDVGHLKRIDISHLPVGLYFIQIGNYSEKFMVVK